MEVECEREGEGGEEGDGEELGPGISFIHRRVWGKRTRMNVQGKEYPSLLNSRRK
jgi:hypothetical protein